MSEENVKAVRSIFARTAEGDFSRWFADVADDFVFVASPDVPDAETPSISDMEGAPRRSETPTRG
jgi:ketosteroid isomerase-like protein